MSLTTNTGHGRGRTEAMNPKLFINTQYRAHYLAGKRAYAEGRPVSNCPYGYGKAWMKRKAWITGWVKAEQENGSA